MKSVLIFNPEHDLALAYGKPNYIPSATVRMMRGDLAVLPMWCAQPGDRVLAASAYNDGFVKKMCDLFPLGVELMVPVELGENGGLCARPWGWDESVRRELEGAGMASEGLCAPDFPQRMRVMAHRAKAVELLGRLRCEEGACGESQLLCSDEACRNFVEGHERCVLKAPLSGSGKGLNWCKGVYTDHIANWCRNVMDGQGAVVGEPMYEKVLDFAMEFRLTGEWCAFAGYSLFNTNRSGAYDANWLAGNNRIVERIAEYVPAERLQRVCSRLESELFELFGGSYEGYLGVDMMVCSVEGAYRLHPCVEVNLRMNMGVVSRLFYDRFCDSGSEGEYHIDYFTKAEEALRHHRSMEEEHPLVVAGGRIVEGYMPLTPVHKNTRYAAWVLLRRS